MSALTLRPASLTLAPLLARLHRESFSVEAWSLAQLRGSLKLETTQGWLAFAGEAPAGFILCQMTAEECEILTFCVRPAQRRKNIGATLIEAALAAARATGIDKIHLEVAADNDVARRLYERLGFRLGGSRPNYYKRGAVTVDAVTYQRDCARES